MSHAGTQMRAGLKDYKREWYLKNRERILNERKEAYWRNRDPNKPLKGCPITDETRKKLSESHKGIKPSKKTKAKMSKIARERGFGKWMKGRILSDSTKKKMSRKGAQNPAWKGGNVGYFALHSWVSRELGRPNKCEHCDTTEVRSYDWANKSGEYKRDLSDWIRLCRPCHRRYDAR